MPGREAREPGRVRRAIAGLQRQSALDNATADKAATDAAEARRLAREAFAAQVTDAAVKAAVDAAVAAATAALMASWEPSGGRTSIGASLLPSATRTVAVPLDHELKSTEHAVAVIAGGATLLGDTYVDGVVIPTNNSGTYVQVRIRNRGLASIAANAVSVEVLAVGPRKT